MVRVLDGEDTIGGSKILVGWDGEGAFLDFGINYARWGQFFEEYVKPRSTSGLGDLWKLGLVPRLEGLYRPDVLPQGTLSGQEPPVKRISAVYVSHAHLDHAGLIGLLRNDLPLVASRTTAAILKATQDCQNANLFSQSVYHTPMAWSRVGGQRVLKAHKGKDFVGRDTFLTDGTGPDAFRTFWEKPPSDGAKSKGLAAGNLRVLQPSSGGVVAHAFAVDHSVLGASGFVLESPQGPIVYSGDLRSHGQQGASTRRFLDGLVRHPPWLLLMEGTQVHPRRVDPEEHELPTTEAEVEANCLQKVEEHRGRLVVADFAPRNIERLLAFLRIAKRTRRRLVIVPKDAYLLHAMNAADPSVPLPSDDLLVLDPPAGTESSWERFALDAAAPHVIDVEELRRRQAEVILCFSYFDIKHLLDVAPEGGCYIYSSSEAHNEEQEIDLERLHTWLEHLGLTPVGFHMIPAPNRRGRKAVKEKGYHASGHMAGDEVLEWVQRIRPEHLLPVHTEHRSGFEQALEGTGIEFVTGGIG